jgi:hypothetical protein
MLRKSIETVVGRHEALRSRVVTVNGIPTQHIDPPREFHLDVVDLTSRSPVDVEREAKQLAQEFLDQKIDLSADPLFDSKLWKLSDHEYVFISSMDHLFSDGISYGILNREIWELYDQGMKGLPFSLPQLPVQFPDYAVWQQRTHRAWKRKHEPYWRQHMTGVQSVQVPCDVALADAVPSVALHIPFGNLLSAKLREAARREGTLPSMLVLAIYVIVISRWCDREDLLITYIAHGRYRRSELENMIGFVANLLYLRIRLTKEDTFRELLTRVQLEVSLALEHRDFDRVPDFIPDCSSEAYFNWQPTNSAKGPLDHHFIPESTLIPTWARKYDAKGKPDSEPSIVPFPMRSGPTKFSSTFYDTTDGIYWAVIYAPNLLAPNTIQKLGHDLKSVAEEVAEHPFARIAGISMRPRNVHGI